jgi:ribosomal protein L12E/L44/L45/RPP1/RPP2
MNDSAYVQSCFALAGITVEPDEIEYFVAALPGLEAMVAMLHEPPGAGQARSALTFAALPDRCTGQQGPGS